MDEQLSKLREGFKVWRNPPNHEEGPTYMGEVFPPVGSFCLTAQDLRELGFGAGRYTVLAPEDFPQSDLFGRWQSLFISE